jgi:hypothetical protein
MVAQIFHAVVYQLLEKRKQKECRSQERTVRQGDCRIIRGVAFAIKG